MQADYVIVGAGSAGCVLANRLTEDPATRVVLIEAGGPDRNPLIHIPAGYVKLLDHKTLTWGFMAEPDPATKLFFRMAQGRAKSLVFSAGEMTLDAARKEPPNP